MSIYSAALYNPNVKKLKDFCFVVLIKQNKSIHTQARVLSIVRVFPLSKP